MEQKRHKALQAIRFLAFTQIFILHSSHFNCASIPYSAAAAVCFFVMLSGFLYGERYCGKTVEISVSSIFKLIKKKIVTFYPLHIVTFFAIIFVFRVIAGKAAFDTLPLNPKTVLLNLLLLQSYVNDQAIYFSFNGVTWYLSTLVFLLVFLYPLVNLFNKVKKGFGNKGLISSLILVWILNFIYVYILHINDLNIEFFAYVFPFARFFDFSAGILIGMIFADNSYEKKIDVNIATVLEVVALAVLLAGIVVTDTDKYFGKWFTRTEFWIPVLMLIFLVFGLDRGKISEFFSMIFFQFLGGISFECFMIHVVTIHLFSIVTPAPLLSRWGLLVVQASILMWTIFLSFLWKSLTVAIKGKRAKKGL